MIFRIVGPPSTPVWREMVMRLLVCGDVARGDVARGDAARGDATRDEPEPAIVVGTTGRVMGVAISSSAVIISGAATRVSASALGAPRLVASASRARNSAVGAVVMLSVRAIRRGGLPPPGLATNMMAPVDGGAPVSCAAVSGVAAPASTITPEVVG